MPLPVVLGELLFLQAELKHEADDLGAARPAVAVAADQQVDRQHRVVLRDSLQFQGVADARRQADAGRRAILGLLRVEVGERRVASRGNDCCTR